MKYWVLQIAFMKLLTPTISVSVELSMLRFCFVELTIGNPCPKDKPPPEFPRISIWTENDASTHHFKISIPLALRVSESLRVPLMYHMRCTKLVWFSSSGDCAFVFINVIAVQVSVLSLLVAHKVFAVICFNSTNFSWYSLLQYLFTTKILLVKSLDFVTFPFRSYL